MSFLGEVDAYSLETLEQHARGLLKSGQDVWLDIEMDPAEERTFALSGRKWVSRMSDRGVVVRVIPRRLTARRLTARRLSGPLARLRGGKHEEPCSRGAVNRAEPAALPDRDPPAVRGQGDGDVGPSSRTLVADRRGHAEMLIESLGVETAFDVADLYVRKWPNNHYWAGVLAELKERRALDVLDPAIRGGPMIETGSPPGKVRSL